MELLAHPAVAVPQPPAPPQDQIQSEQVWQVLNLEQQQTVLDTIVRVCRSLMTPPVPKTRSQEERHESA